MNRPNKFWFRYLPVTPDAERWGLYVLDAGYTLIPPDTPYPPGKHPIDHMFSWERGRTLDSFTLVYITRGQGIFESKRGGRTSVSAGDLFILFPNEWHRYRPDPVTGWDEYWVEFDGEQARRIMNHPGFSEKKPVVCIGHQEKILRLFIEITECIEQGPSEFEHIIAAQASQIVAWVLATIPHQQGTGRADKTIQYACCRILEQFDRDIDFELLARDLGMSSSGFRKKFQKVTGLPVGKYVQQIRLKKAGELLRQTELSVGEIAELVGFESIYYFSRLFKKKTGLPPSVFRNNESLQRPTTAASRIRAS
jgi:AraC-like DNA-binding protein